MDNAIIAKVCHEANLVICQYNGDNSQKSWNQAAPWQRESAIKGVEFRINNPDATPEDQHNAWMEDKINAGWVFGPEKDEVAKTHHCLVPYNELPEFQRTKDHLFQGIVDSLKQFIKDPVVAEAPALDVLNMTQTEIATANTAGIIENVTITVSDADIKENPELSDAGVKVGDEIVIEKDAVVEAPAEVKAEDMKMWGGEGDQVQDTPKEEAAQETASSEAPAAKKSTKKAAATEEGTTDQTTA